MGLTTIVHALNPHQLVGKVSFSFFSFFNFFLVDNSNSYMSFESMIILSLGPKLGKKKHAKQ